MHDELMLLTYLERDRPVLAKISVRPVKEPETDGKACHACDEWAGTERVLSERERRRHDPNQRDEESDPCDKQESSFKRSLVALSDLDPSTPVAVWCANRDQHYRAREYHRFRDPRVHAGAPLPSAAC